MRIGEKMTCARQREGRNPQSCSRLRSVLPSDAKIIQRTAHLHIGDQHPIISGGGGMLMTKAQNHQSERNKRSGKSVRYGLGQLHLVQILWFFDRNKLLSSVKIFPTRSWSRRVLVVAATE